MTNFHYDESTERVMYVTFLRNSEEMVILQNLAESVAETKHREL